MSPFSCGREGIWTQIRNVTVVSEPAYHAVRWGILVPRMIGSFEMDSQTSSRREISRGFRAIFALALPFLAAVLPACAQRSRDAEEAVAGCAACSMLLAVPAVIIGILVLHIVLFIWVARDAKARGVDNAAVWVIIVMIGGIIGLIVYIFSRPQGNLVSCPNCSNKRLQASVKCPQCGA